VKNSAGKEFALLPLEHPDYFSQNTPCFLVPIRGSSAEPFDRLSKLKLAYYYSIFAQFDSALRTLKSIPTTSNFGEIERKYIHNIIGYDKQHRPEMYSIIYYAIYLEFKLDKLDAPRKEEYLDPAFDRVHENHFKATG